MDAIILDGPAVEPVTLAEAKAFLRLDGTDEDDLVGALITAARLTVERAARITLIRQTWRVTLTRWPAARVLRLPIAPVSAVVAARVVDASGTATLPAGTCRLRPDDGSLLSVDPAAAGPGEGGRIEIDLQCGFGPDAGAVPETLKLAIRRLVAEWFENRGDEAPRTGLALPSGVAALLAPYRRARLA